MAEPSKLMPSSSAPSSSAGVIAKPFSEPSTSVNQSWTKRTPRSSTVRRTYSSCGTIGCSRGPVRGPVRVPAGAGNGRPGTVYGALA